ncbi:SMP-30/gluconolactonase/LRE family protein [uncultured Amaricoccus sp.]|uniref:SMP-30/gluconolactonase/LRE family protein n=1 Tax=uncultured Amaricoccus sp. TaxID=339341 RepID=UPI002601DA6C|nr:SMP-30/gluconolactonase/LRE family protein [uncultured Amaricoccus sp.]
MAVFDERRCELGEGVLWHPGREQLFWFDILDGALLSRRGEAALRWDFGECVSAAGWLDQDRLLIAAESGLWRFDVESGARERVAEFPTGDGPATRSNDGRADPWGGFWIGTMGKNAEQAAGAIWRLWRGELRRVRGGVSIPNAICFDAARELAYFTDTRVGIIWAQPLDPATGWPAGEARVFLDLREEGLRPDGAVIDAEGRLWNAQWGSGRVACYGPDGVCLGAERFNAARTSCPAFGGPMLDTLYVTTAQEGMDVAARAAEPAAGMTFGRPLAARGRPEPAVILG